MRALVAIEHSMITAIWHMLTNGAVFEDLGDDCFQRTHASGTRRNAINQLHKLEYEVELTALGAQPPKSAPDKNAHRHQRQATSARLQAESPHSFSGQATGDGPATAGTDALAATHNQLAQPLTPSAADRPCHPTDPARTRAAPRPRIGRRPESKRPGFHTAVLLAASSVDDDLFFEGGVLIGSGRGRVCTVIVTGRVRPPSAMRASLRCQD